MHYFSHKQRYIHFLTFCPLNPDTKATSGPCFWLVVFWWLCFLYLTIKDCVTGSRPGSCRWWRCWGCTRPRCWPRPSCRAAYAPRSLCRTCRGPWPGAWVWAGASPGPSTRPQTCPAWPAWARPAGTWRAGTGSSWEGPAISTTWQGSGVSGNVYQVSRSRDPRTWPPSPTRATLITLVSAVSTSLVIGRNPFFLCEWALRKLMFLMLFITLLQGRLLSSSLSSTSW